MPKPNLRAVEPTDDEIADQIEAELAKLPSARNLVFRTMSSLENSVRILIAERDKLEREIALRRASLAQVNETLAALEPARSRLAQAE